MALTEEDLSAMLQASHPNQGLMSMSLANAMLSSRHAMDASSRDLLVSAQLPYSPLQRTQHPMDRGPAAMNVTNMNLNMQRGTMDRSSASMGTSGSSGSEWPLFLDDEKWELDCKNEVLDSASVRGGSYGGAHKQGLERYHSAPSSFLQCLVDFGDDEAPFAHVSTNPLGDSSTGGSGSGRNDHLRYFNDSNLAPIMESAPSRWTTKQPEKLDLARSNPLNSTEQYFAIQADNARQSESTMNAATLGAADGTRTLKKSLLRQSSSPAELLAAINNQREDVERNDASMQRIARSQDDISSTAKKSMAPLFSNPAYAFNGDAMTGGGMGNIMPTSPAGKRVRFPDEMTDDVSLDLLRGDDSRVPRAGSLTRHQSLPSNSTGDGLSPTDLGYDDLLDLYAPCKTRARRGYATHPRSIAERNRRGRISERMKKLQDLVPNMDKQTNTTDMLDEAVEYVKHLQLQVKDLSETVVRLQNAMRQPNAGATKP